jgi:glycine C-acetyltransferase/8-amino-7-oxononanoate synthase
MGQTAKGINLASQDYLGLSSHPDIREAAMEALELLGPYSAGSPCLLGNTPLSLELERALAALVDMQHVVLFPTGWAAGYGAIGALVRKTDYVVMDALSHNCLQQGANAATPNVRLHKHLDVNNAREVLEEIRGQDTRNGILVVTEGLFSMDSDFPDIQELQDLCHEYDATLMVDVAHDLGSLGPGGAGNIGAQNMLGKVDLVMGSFSKTFASNGGFLAMQSEAVKQYVKYYGASHTFSNALSPVQSAIVLRAVEIIRSPEGEWLRQRLMHAVLTLRNQFERRGFQCLGEPSAIVPVPVGNEGATRLASSLMFEKNVFGNPVEFPAVPVGSARFRLQVMATHTPAQMIRAADVTSASIGEANRRIRGAVS